MAALVAALVVQAGDRPAWLAAILADRYRAPGTVMLSALIALAAASGITVAAGLAIAGMLTPAARDLLLAMALLLQGGGALFAHKPPERLANWRLGGFATSLLGLFILCFGDGLQFVVGAIAIRSTMPWMAVAGATLGGIVVLGAAAVMGERDWCRLPRGRIRQGGAVICLMLGVIFGLSGLRLI
ncbi:TMEM165/GDT1 family protein [uncultured Sphingomonas sp.]|uniref:TMEM165/GDT1 family protein n=1 Tax=uncultured Sphingomonas sp. TaxID=158754 RepID=UPI00260CE967|nr:TMEM165/GDT1 family protein [uncultured Sphingomonas sp.]